MRRQVPCLIDYCVAGVPPAPSGQARHLQHKSFFLALLAVALSGLTLPAAEPDPPKVRELFVPFKDLNVLLENQPRRVLLSREQYDELLKKAKTTPAGHVPRPAVLLAADYVGTSDSQRVRLTGTLSIDVLEKGLHALPLDLGSVGLLAAKLDGVDAPIGRSPGGQLSLLVEGVGRHTLVLDMTVPLETTAAQQLLNFRLPRAAAGRLRLTVPGDVELKTGADVAGREVDHAAGVTRFELLPTSGDTTLVMSLNSHLQRREQAVVARSVLVDEVTAAYEKLHVTMSLAILYRAVDRFRFVVPDGFEITEIASPLLARWEIQREGGRRIASVRLREQTTEAVVLNIAAIRTASPLGAWQLPRLEPLDVVGHVAVIGLLAEQPLKAESITAEGLIPIDVDVLRRVLPASLEAGRSLRALAAYYAPQGHFGLAARFVKPAAELAVTTNVLLIIADGGLTAQGGWAMLPDVEKRFSFDFTLPAGWQVASVSGPDQRPLSFEQYGSAGAPDATAPGARIHVQLPQGIPVGQTYRAYFHAVRTPPRWLTDWKTNSVEFPAFSIVGATHEEGAVAVATRDDMTPRPEKLERLVPLDENEKGKYGLAGVEANLAYRFEKPPYAATLTVERTQPRLTARTFSCFRVQPDGLKAHYELLYHIEEARTRRLTFSLPDTTPASLKIEGLGDTRLKEFSSEAVGADKMRRWNVSLEEARRGEVRLGLDFQQPLPSQEPKDYPLPIVRAEGVAYQSGLVSVEGSAEQDVQVKKTAARRVDVGELAAADYQPGRRLLGAYGFIGAPPVVAIDVSLPAGYPLYPAIAERAELTTLLSAQGASQTQARFTLRTKALYLEVALPSGAELWSAQLLQRGKQGDGTPLKPQREGDRLLIGLPAGAAGAVYPLQLIYAAPVEKVALRGTMRVPAPRLLLRADRRSTAVEVPLADLVWRLHLPSGYEVTRTAGSLSPTDLHKPAPAAMEVLGAMKLLAGGVNPFYGITTAADQSWRVAQSVNEVKHYSGRGEGSSQSQAESSAEAARRQQYVALAAAQQSPAEKKIERTLKSPTQLEFIETPLADVVDYLKDYHQIDIQFDKKAMEDAGVGTDTPVTKNLKGISLRSALRLMLRDLGLTYVIQDEVLLITTPEAAESRLTTKIYPVDDLVVSKEDPDYDSLIELITATVQPTTWDAVGGPGSIAAQSAGGARTLVISQTQEVHEEVADVLQNIRETAARYAATQSPEREPNPAEKKIEEALDSPTRMEFVETPLQNVVDSLKKDHKIEIQLDKKAMEDVGIGTDTPVTKNLKGVSLRSALRMTLRELGLTYVIQDGVLMITPPEAAENRLTTVVYPVSDLVLCRDEEGHVGPDYESLVAIITSTVQPTTWDVVGGRGSIAQLSVRDTHTLVLSQTQEVHAQIAALLKNLRKIKELAEQNGNHELPLRRKPPATQASGMGGGMGGGFGGGMGGMMPGNQQQSGQPANQEAAAAPAASAPAPQQAAPAKAPNDPARRQAEMDRRRVRERPRAYTKSPSVVSVVPTKAKPAADVAPKAPEGPPIVYPDSEVWKQLTEQRKEKYSSMDASKKAADELPAAEPESEASENLAARQAMAMEELPKPRRLQGLSSLKIQLQDAPQAADSVVTFQSLGDAPILVVTLANRTRLDALGWGLALAVGLWGLALTNRPAGRKVRFLFVVAIVATLLPLAWDSVEVAQVCNMVFYAASLLVPYYLLAGLVKWFARSLHCCCVRAVPPAAAAAVSLVLIWTAGMLVAPAARGEDGAEIAVDVRTPAPPVVVPEDAIIRPYDKLSEGGTVGADRLLVPYAHYVELWNRAHPDKKLEVRPAPLPYALAGASYSTTLEGGEYLLLSGKLSIEVYGDDYVEIPLRLRGGVLARAELDGKPARLGMAEVTINDDAESVPAANAPMHGVSGAMAAPAAERLRTPASAPVSSAPASRPAPRAPRAPRYVPQPARQSGNGRGDRNGGVMGGGFGGGMGGVGGGGGGGGFFNVVETPPAGNDNPFDDPEPRPASPAQTTVPQGDDPFARLPAQRSPSSRPQIPVPAAEDPFAPHPAQPIAAPVQANAPSCEIEPSDALVVLYVKGKGRHALALDIRVRLSRQGGWRVADAVVPAAPASSLAIAIPSGQTELRLSQVADRKNYELDKAGQSITTALGSDGQLNLQWRPKVAEAQVDRGLTSQSVATVDVQEDGVRVVWDMSLEFRRGQRDGFRVSVPKGYMVGAVVGDNVRGWEVHQAERDQAIEIALLKTAKDREQFTLHLWRGGAVGHGDLAEFDVPLVEVSGAAQASGQLNLRRSPLLDVRTLEHSGVARADLDPAVDAAAGGPSDASPLGIHPYQTYHFATMPYRLRLAAAPLAAKTTADVETLVKLGELQRTLESRVLLHVQDRAIYRVEMLLPEDLKVQRVSAPGDFHWALTRRDHRPRLSIYLTAGQQGEVPVLLDGTLSRAEQTPSLALPDLEVCDVERQAGDIAVQVDPAFDVEARDLVGCQEAELAQVEAWLDPRQRQTTRLALHYRQPGYRGTLRLAQRKADVTCETISNVRVTDRALAETLLLTFTIRGAGIRDLVFQLPAEMAQARISVPMLRQKTIEPVGKGPGSPVRVRLELQEEMMDEVRVLVENDRLLTSQLYSVPIPTVETGRTSGQYVTIESAGRDEVEVKTSEGLEPLSRQQKQWQTLQDILHNGITLAYMVSPGAAKPALGFRTVGHAEVEVAGARIGLAETTLVVDAHGAYRAAVTFHVDNRTEQFLKIELPEAATLWTVAVAGEPVKPTEDPAAAGPWRLLVPLVKTASGELDYRVVLKYGGRMEALGRFNSVSFPLVHTKNINIERSVVKLYLPETHQWFDFGGTMRLVGDERDVTAVNLSYQTKQAERLVETMRQSNPFAQQRASNNLKTLSSSLEQYRTESQRSAAGNASLQEELQKSEGVLQQAKQQVEQAEKTPAAAELQDNRDRLNNLYAKQQTTRSRNVVNDLGRNWSEAAPQPQQNQPQSGKFNNEWFDNNQLDNAANAPSAADQPIASPGGVSLPTAGRASSGTQQPLGGWGYNWQGKPATQPAAPEIAQGADKEIAKPSPSKAFGGKNRRSDFDGQQEDVTRYHEKLQQQGGQSWAMTSVVQTEVMIAVNQARGMMATNPVLALQTLREEAEKIKQVPDLAPATRDQLMNTLQAAIGEATRHLTAHEGHRQERQERIAAAKERAVLDDDSAAAGGRVYPVADLVLPLSTTPAAPTGLASLDFQLPQRGQLYQFITPRGEVEITAQAVSSNMMTKLQRLAIALVAILAIGFALRLARQGGVGPLGGPGATTLMICLGVLSVLTGVLPIAGLVLFLSGLVLKIRRAAARSRAARVSPVAKATP